MRVHGETIVSFEAASPENNGTSTIVGTGRRSDGVAVKYVVRVIDYGEPGAADYFEIEVTQLDGGAPVDAARGTLGGGNIQFHDRPSRCPQ